MPRPLVGKLISLHEDEETDLPMEPIATSASTFSQGLFGSIKKSKHSSVRSSFRASLMSGELSPRSKATSSDWGKRLARNSIFNDTESLKAQVRAALVKPSYNVEDYYKTTGLWQRIARSPFLESSTQVVIAINAVWLAIETDYNSQAIFFRSEPIFQFSEQFFCLFFMVEWFVRFMAFKRIVSGMKDGWFVFDSMLVLTMMIDTWVMCFVFWIWGSSLSFNTSLLRLIRLLRLMRVARMARLLRAMPELMILIKGGLAAMKSVAYTLFLLLIILYIFAIGFTQLASSSELGAIYFNSVPESMYSLLVCGTFFDNIGNLMDKLAEEGFHFLAIFLMYVLLASYTVLNMLIGVLCEVVSVVAACEREGISVAFVKGKIQSIISDFDQDNDDKISKSEFLKLIYRDDAIRALSEVGVDPAGLVELADVIFDDGDSYSRELSFADFMDVVLSFRGSNNATVKDTLTLQKYVRQLVEGTHRQVDCRLIDLHEILQDIANHMQVPPRRDKFKNVEKMRKRKVHRSSEDTRSSVQRCLDKVVEYPWVLEEAEVDLSAASNPGDVIEAANYSNDLLSPRFDAISPPRFMKLEPLLHKESKSMETASHDLAWLQLRLSTISNDLEVGFKRMEQMLCQLCREGLGPNAVGIVQQGFSDPNKPKQFFESPQKKAGGVGGCKSGSPSYAASCASQSATHSGKKGKCSTEPSGRCETNSVAGSDDIILLP